MKFKLYGELQGLEAGIQIVADKLGFELIEDGFPIKVERTIGTLEAVMEGNEGFIRFEEKIHFFRALGLFVEAMRQGGTFNLTEEPQFSLNGVMIDVSRNSVMKVESLKKTIEIMAMMGLNMIMLYMEDTYTVDTRPYFGYMRGRYSYDELKVCDEYADIFGIEIIPCIQTLAHLTGALKWECTRELRDTEDILLVGSEQTYVFVEEMIKAASAPFKSKKIHIGMDEAHNLGLGRYLDMNGYQSRFDIMNTHLARVKEIATSHGLKPMIWSDMYFRLASKTRDYYDLEAVIPDEVIEKVSKDVQLVYWDYYHHDEKIYSELIRRHKRFTGSTIFAGGIWTWNGMMINYEQTLATTNAALDACKQEGIKEVFATMWGDNGAETNFFSGLLGLQIYAEHGYARNPEVEKLIRRFKFCTGGDYDAFIKLSSFDNLPTPWYPSNPSNPSNPSKFLLWQDLLLGLFDRHVEGSGLNDYYAELEEDIGKIAEAAGEWKIVFDVPQKLASVLSVKSEMGIKMKNSYDRKDMKMLKEIAETDLANLYKRVSELRESHKKQWFITYKSFGWEVLDIRYGGLLVRIESAAGRLKEYINGEIDNIDELEEERLFFDGPDRPEAAAIGHCNLYARIVTAGSL